MILVYKTPYGIIVIREADVNLISLELANGFLELCISCFQVSVLLLKPIILSSAKIEFEALTKNQGF